MKSVIIALIKEKYIVLSASGCIPIMIKENVKIPHDIMNAEEYLIKPTEE